jgi:Phage integrase family
MVIFAAATGLRPSELFGLDHRDVDRQLGVVYVRRAYANGRLKHTKTRLSTRAVPLQAKALEALDRLPASDNPILFSNVRGGRIDFRIFGRKHWRPAQSKAGIDPVRGLYDLRHTYATSALRAPRWCAGVRGLTVHGHEHRDDRPPLRPPRQRQPRPRSFAPRRARLRAGRGRWVDVAANAPEASQEDGCGPSNAPAAPPRGRAVDATPRSCRLDRRPKELISGNDAKPLADSNRGPPPYHKSRGGNRVHARSIVSTFVLQIGRS